MPYVKKMLKISLALLMFSFSAIMISNNANAWTCMDFNKTDMADSLKDACGRQFCLKNPNDSKCTGIDVGNGPYGALWISGSNAEDNVSGEITVNSREAITAYLRGVVIGRSSYSTAHDIHVVRGDTHLNCGIGVAKDYSPIMDVPSEFMRSGVVGLNDKIISTFHPIKIDINKIIELEGDKSTDNGYKRYEIKLQMFRCPQGITYGTCNACYSSASTLKINIPEKVVNMNRTLTPEPVDTEGKPLSSIIKLEPTTVPYNSRASVTAVDAAGYTFKGWKVAAKPEDTPHAGFITTTNAYTVENLKEEATVYAVYKKKIKLIVYAMLNFDKKKYLGEYGNIVDKSDAKTWTSDEVVSGSNASVTVDQFLNDKDGKAKYGFLQYGGGGSYCKDLATRKCEAKITGNTDIELNAYFRNGTLTVKAVDEGGNFISAIKDISAMIDGSKTIPYGKLASVKRTDGTSVGWEFVGWKADRKAKNTIKTTNTKADYYVSNESGDAYLTYNARNIKSNITVYAVYKKKTTPAAKKYTVRAFAADSTGKIFDRNGKPSDCKTGTGCYNGDGVSKYNLWQWKTDNVTSGFSVTIDTTITSKTNSKSSISSILSKDYEVDFWTLDKKKSCERKTSCSFSIVDRNDGNETFTIIIYYKKKATPTPAAKKYTVRAFAVESGSQKIFDKKKGETTSCTANPAGNYCWNSNNNLWKWNKEDIVSGSNITIDTTSTSDTNSGSSISSMLSKNYKVDHWALDGKTSCISKTECSFSIVDRNDGNKTFTILIYYKKKTTPTPPKVFRGETILNVGGEDQTAVISDGKNERRVNINNCTDGCRVKFKHYLQRTSGTGPTDYNVTRSSNLTSTKSKRVVSAGELGNGNFDNSKKAQVLAEKSIEHTLYPGMVVCEKLSFDSNTKYTRYCASALGYAQPTGEDLDGDGTMLKAQVSKASKKEGPYKDYKKGIYVKPDDFYDVKITYNPVLQYTYYLIPEKYQINDGTIYSNSTIESNGYRILGCDRVPAKKACGEPSQSATSIKSGFNQYKGSGLQNWNNAFSVKRIVGGKTEYITFGGGTMYLKRDPGNFDKSTRNINTGTKIASNNVGQTIQYEAIVNDKNNAAAKNGDKTTPTQVSFKNDDNRNLGNVITTGDVKSSISIKVPYNFDFKGDGGKVEIASEGTAEPIVYAGESRKIKANIAVGTRLNKLVGSTYKTKIPDGSKYKVQISTNGSSYKDVEKSEKEIYGLGPWDNNESGEVIVPDLPAGSKIYLRIAVYPKNTCDKDDVMDMSDITSSCPDNWATSDPVTFTVAKKPSLQVLGGNVYSGGQIKTSVSNKKEIAKPYGSPLGLPSSFFGVSLYGPLTNGGNKVGRSFGSWGELGVIQSGGVVGFASGAVLGNTPNTSNPSNITNFPGIVSGNSICKLTFTNNNCDVTGDDPVASSTIEVKNLISDNKRPLLEAIGLTKGEGEGDKIGPQCKMFNMPAGSGPEDCGNDKVIIDDSGNIKITNGRDDKSLTVNEPTTITDLDKVPRIVVYATGNIYIDCNVGQIDALLIANENVYTCVDGTTNYTSDNSENKEIKNNKSRSKQLIINGAIVANKLIPGRTYGARTGIDGSAMPAEIINFDPTLYLLNTGKNTTTEINLNLSSIREIAPRK